MTVKRFDRAALSAPKRMPNGWLKVDGYVGRTGLLEYVLADGSKWVEYRPADEAFKEDVLASFEGVPFTNDHPPGGLLTASNTKDFQVGTVGRPTQDGKFLRSTILVTDAAAIEAIEAGKCELSQGYCCELDMTPGEHEGQRYDAVQRHIQGNHVALVDQARAGPEARLRIDGKDTLPVDSKQLPGQPPIPGKKVIKIKIDGVEVEVSELAAQLIAKQGKAHTDALNALIVKAEQVTARADSAEADVKKLKADLADAPAKARAAITARIALEAAAGKVLGAEVKLDGLSDLDVQKKVAEQAGFKLEGKSDAYVQACFDLAGAKLDPKEAPTAPMPRADDGADSLAAAQAKMRADMRAQCKQ